MVTTLKRHQGNPLDKTTTLLGVEITGEVVCLPVGWANHQLTTILARGSITELDTAMSPLEARKRKTNSQHMKWLKDLRTTTKPQILLKAIVSHWTQWRLNLPSTTLAKLRLHPTIRAVSTLGDRWTIMRTQATMSHSHLNTLKT